MTGTHYPSEDLTKKSFNTRERGKEERRKRRESGIVCVCVKERERERRVAFHSVSWFRIAAWPVCVNYVNGDLFSAFVCQSLGTTTKK